MVAAAGLLLTAGIHRDDKPAQNWAEFMRDTLVESPSPIPGKGIGDAFSGIPFKDIDAKRQIYKEIADDLYDDDNNTGLTWYQDPEHHRRPYRFGQ